MLSRDTNLNQLRIFSVVFRSGSMTAAAKELHLTQSGVSQHVSALEKSLNVVLFDRMKQRIVPTPAASLLYRKCVEALGGIDQALSEIKQGEREVHGLVTIGAPVEFANNVITPLLAPFAAKHPSLRLQIRHGFTDELDQALARGQLDFAFMDAFGSDRRIQTARVYDEILHLCASKDYLKKHSPVRETRAWFEGLDYVDYPMEQTVLSVWFEHHLRAKRISLNIRATVADAQGVAKLITSGWGVGILPGHLVASLQKQRQPLHVFRGCGTPFKNRIDVAHLKGRSWSHAAKATFDYLLSRL